MQSAHYQNFLNRSFFEWIPFPHDLSVIHVSSQFLFVILSIHHPLLSPASHKKGQMDNTFSAHLPNTKRKVAIATELDFRTGVLCYCPSAKPEQVQTVSTIDIYRSMSIFLYICLWCLLHFPVKGPNNNGLQAYELLKVRVSESNRVSYGSNLSSCLQLFYCPFLFCRWTIK